MKQTSVLVLLLVMVLLIGGAWILYENYESGYHPDVLTPVTRLRILLPPRIQQIPIPSKPPASPYRTGTETPCPSLTCWANR